MMILALSFSEVNYWCSARQGKKGGGGEEEIDQTDVATLNNWEGEMLNSHRAQNWAHAV